MASVNKVILLGNCGRDAEVRYLPSGQAVANVSLATTSTRKDKTTGEKIEDTQWHRVTFYDRMAEIAGEYVKKGKAIYVEGRIKYGKYTDQSGVEKNTVDIVATDLKLLGGRDDGQHSGAPQGHAPQGQPPRQPAPPQRNGYAEQSGRGAPRQPPQNQGAPRASSGFDDMDDDIPF